MTITQFSLNSSEFLSIENDLLFHNKNFYYDKRTIPCTLPVKDALTKFKKSMNFNFKTFLNEYDMSYMSMGKSLIVKGSLDPVFRKYIMYVTKFLCQSSSKLKPIYTLQGKNAEGVFMLFVNNILNYFRCHNRLQFSKKSFQHGGDLGSDFKLDDLRFDIKHRDDRPGSGLILRRNFLEKPETENDMIIVLGTNASNTKLGDLGINDDIEKAVKEQTLPVALTGWITIGEYKEKMKERPGDDFAYVVDELNDMASLMTLIVEKQIKSQDLFVSPFQSNVNLVSANV